MLAGASKEGLGAGPGLHVGGGSRVSELQSSAFASRHWRSDRLLSAIGDTGRGAFETCARILGETSK
jgi:hypothetical protein